MPTITKPPAATDTRVTDTRVTDTRVTDTRVANTTVTVAGGSTDLVGFPSRPNGPISLSQFYPFVLADPIGQRAVIRSIIGTHGLYSPAIDYWRLLRLQIVAFHAYEQPAFDALDAGLELAHPDRLDHYRRAIVNYRRFLGRKTIEWTGEPYRCTWSAFGLQVRVNPELAMTINGVPHVIKLHLRADDSLALTQRKANPMLHLLGQHYGDLGRPMVLDLMRGRVFTRTQPEVDFEPLLQAQAAGFLTHWRAEALEAGR